MKRCIVILLALLLLASCGEKGQAPDQEPSSFRGEAGPVSAGGSLPDEQPQDNLSEELLDIAFDFAENFYNPFSSPEDVAYERFCLSKLLENDPEVIFEDGYYWVSRERLEEEVRLRFDLPGYRFQSPESESLYPRFVEEKNAIAFDIPADPKWLIPELIGQAVDGEYYDYTMVLYNEIITDLHPERTLEQTLRYRFRVVETADGAPFLQAVSAVDLDPEPDPEPLPQPDIDPDQRPLYFSLGPQGEVKALRAGDTLGDWTLESYDAQWDIEGRDIPRVDEAVFTAPADAPVEIKCTVSLNPMALPNRYYEFFVEEEDLDKLPVMEGDGRTVWFSADDNAALTQLADLGEKERRYCRVAVSSYNVVCIPMMSSNGANIVWLELE